MTRYLEEFAEIASDWFWETDENHVFIYFSDRFSEVTGVPKSCYLGERRDQIALENLHDDKWRAHLDDLRKRRPFRNLEYWTKRPNDGSDLCIRVSGIPIFTPNGVFKGYRGVGTDITCEQLFRRELKKSNQALERRNQELERARQSLEQIALHDALTGLPNRRFFDDTIDELQRCSMIEQKRVLISIDLDQFKYINDKFGHDVGDQLLRYVADELRKLLSAEDFLARLGGDEFIIICAEGSTLERAARIGERIVKTFAQPVVLDDHLCRFGASVGYIEHPAATLREGVKRADAALYDAKRAGRGVARRFEAKQHAEFSRTKRIADEIAAGLERRAFEAFFQPQFDATSFRLTGVEALARWRHPTRGVLGPDQFLAIAEDYGLLEELDEQIFENAVALCQNAAQRGVEIPKCAVNVSLLRLKSEAFLDSVARAHECGASIAFELLETSSFEQDDATVAANLDGLRRSGCEIEIDDFGSGFASITSLIRIEPHRLKIDRSLIGPLADSEKHQRLVAGIIELGRTLSVDVIAEGVETWRHVELLRDIGCDGFQGYLFARPMSADALLEFVEQESWRAALRLDLGAA